MPHNLTNFPAIQKILTVVQQIVSLEELNAALRKRELLLKPEKAKLLFQSVHGILRSFLEQLTRLGEKEPTEDLLETYTLLDQIHAHLAEITGHVIERNALLQEDFSQSESKPQSPRSPRM